jgi:UDP-N-acetylglucosamine 2-epimerase (hydrolysing)
MTTRRVAFITGTRADYGKIKSLIACLDKDDRFEVHIFVTGMHMLSKYGMTFLEVERAAVGNIYKFINQSRDDTMDVVLAKTIGGLSDFVKEIQPDLLVVHGDRVEALAGAIVGSLNNILVAHIEGGEVSGTIDELIRHAVTKMSHIHLVANEQARQRLMQLGEEEKCIHLVGSPDLDIMFSPNLPPLIEARDHYDFYFEQYGIILFHPVTTELEKLEVEVGEIIAAVNDSTCNWLVIYPNNDHGSNIILSGWKKLKTLSNVRLYPSLRFEYFLVLLKNASFILGNSSVGVREAPAYGVPSINLGSRQHNRAVANTIMNIECKKEPILRAIENTHTIPKIPVCHFGDGKSDQLFFKILSSDEFWSTAKQKYFVDRVFG